MISSPRLGDTTAAATIKTRAALLMRMSARQRSTDYNLT